MNKKLIILYLKVLGILVAVGFILPLAIKFMIYNLLPDVHRSDNSIFVIYNNMKSESFLEYVLRLLKNIWL